MFTNFLKVHFNSRKKATGTGSSRFYTNQIQNEVCILNIICIIIIIISFITCSMYQFKSTNIYKISLKCK